MPIKDVKCNLCGYVREEIVKTDEPPPHCKKCGKDDTVYLVGTPAFKLYGEGFYKRTHKDSGDFA